MLNASQGEMELGKRTPDQSCGFSWRIAKRWPGREEARSPSCPVLQSPAGPPPLIGQTQSEIRSLGKSGVQIRVENDLKGQAASGNAGPTEKNDQIFDGVLKWKLSVL